MNGRTFGRFPTKSKPNHESTSKDPVKKITYACGHTRNAETSKECNACRAAKRDAARKDKKSAIAADTELLKQTGLDKCRRLPDRSKFVVEFSTAHNAWTGTLTTVLSGRPITITKKKGKLFSLLASIDRDYRILLAKDGRKNGGL